MMGSITWLRMKPSKCTIMGRSTRLSSAIRWAMITMSTASWPFSAKICSQPTSRSVITSEWSFQMLMGPDRARLATTITMGSRRLAAMNRISCMSARPWLAVAVKVRAPAAAVPQQVLMAACSDSTGMNSASSSPSATISERCSTTWVWGVIG